MLVTLSGIEMLLSLLQTEKAPVPISFTPFSIVTLFQLIAVVKSEVANADDTSGDGEVLQLIAAIESLRTNADDAVGNMKALQVAACLE